MGCNSASYQFFWLHNKKGQPVAPLNTVKSRWSHHSKTVDFEHIELPAKLLDYFLRSSKSNTNQDNTRTTSIDCCLVKYMFFKASSVFIRCITLHNIYMLHTPSTPRLCHLNIRVFSFKGNNTLYDIKCCITYICLCNICVVQCCSMLFRLSNMLYCLK